MAFCLKRWVNTVGVVTGASSGIGAAICKRLVEEGIIVVGIARRVELVQGLAEKLTDCKGKLHPYKADITKEEEIVKAFKYIKENIGDVNILVNSAGMHAHASTLSDGDPSAWRKVFDTNVMGLCIATREAVRSMKENSICGQIIHVSSILGHYVAHLPNLNVYPATKFAIRALTETLRQEFLVSGSPIRVCTISPGPTDTEFNKNAKGADEEFSEKFDSMPKLKAEDVANGVVYVLSTPPHVQIQDIMMRPLGEPV